MGKIIGKTICGVFVMKKPNYDDMGWLKLEFTDGTRCIVEAYYGAHTGASEDEYPTNVRIVESVEGLEELFGEKK